MRAIAVVLLAASCSPFMSRPRAGAGASVEPRCDPTSPVPHVDLVMSGLSLGVSLISLIAFARDQSELRNVALLVIVPVAVAGFGYGLSAAYGYSVRRDCKKALQAWERLPESRQDELVWSEELREELGEIADATHTAIELDGSTIAVKARRADPGACARLDWARALRKLDLAGRGDFVASCRAGSFVVWSGPVTQLPKGPLETRCRPDLERIAGERDPARRGQLYTTIRPACRIPVRSIGADEGAPTPRGR